MSSRSSGSASLIATPAVVWAENATATPFSILLSRTAASIWSVTSMNWVGRFETSAISRFTTRNPVSRSRASALPLLIDHHPQRGFGRARRAEFAFEEGQQDRPGAGGAGQDEDDSADDRDADDRAEQGATGQRRPGQRAVAPAQPQQPPSDQEPDRSSAQPPAEH